MGVLAASQALRSCAADCADNDPCGVWFPLEEPSSPFVTCDGLGGLHDAEMLDEIDEFALIQVKGFKLYHQAHYSNRP